MDVGSAVCVQEGSERFGQEHLRGIEVEDGRGFGRGVETDFI